MATHADRIAAALRAPYRAQLRESNRGRVVASLPSNGAPGVDFTAVTDCEVCGCDVLAGGGTAWLSLPGIDNPDHYRAAAESLGATFEALDEIQLCEALGGICTCLECYTDEAPADDTPTAADHAIDADAMLAAAADALSKAADDLNDRAQFERVRRAAAALRSL